MAFLDSEKTDIRRFCGFSAFGSGATGFSSWRFATVYGDLEFKMNNLSAAEETVVRTYLGTLGTLETAISTSGLNLDIDTAAVYKRNINETRDRTRLFNQWRRALCGFLGLPAGPDLKGSGITLVV